MIFFSSRSLHVSSELPHEGAVAVGQRLRHAGAGAERSPAGGGFGALRLSIKTGKMRLSQINCLSFIRAVQSDRRSRLLSARSRGDGEVSYQGALKRTLLRCYIMTQFCYCGPYKR